jgi:DDE superfamily endonuclease
VEKKAHTFKELLISDKNKRILYISKTYEGKAHDYGLLKQEFPPEKAWFKKFKVHLDLGFQGFSDLYPCKKLCIPIKKEKATKTDKKELTELQKEHNKSLSQERVFVEHSIGGMKRYRILSNRNRLKNKKTINKVIGVCAALWNYTIIT